MEIDSRMTPEELADFIEARWDSTPDTDVEIDDEDNGWFMKDIQLPSVAYRIYHAEFRSIGETGPIDEWSIRVMDDHFSTSAGVTNRNNKWEFGTTGLAPEIIDAIIVIKLAEG